MNKKLAPLHITENINKEFVPVSVFMKYMSEANDLPYPSELSAEPFYNRLKSMAHSSCQYTSEAISPMLAKAKKHLKENKLDFNLENIEENELQTMMAMMFPSMFLDNKLSFIAPPFKKQFRFQTPATRTLFNNPDWMMKVNLAAHNEKMISTTVKAGAFLLKKFYDVEMENFHSMVITLRNVKTELERHFKVELKHDFVEAEAIKPLKKLSKRQISELLNNVYNEDLWLEALPPENFSFKGFLIGTFHDVTGLETMSLLKNKLLLNDEEMKPEIFFPFIEQQLKNFLGLSDISVGMVMVLYEQFFQGEAFSLTGTNDTMLLRGIDSEDGVYKNAFSIKEPILFDDLTQVKFECEAKDLLLANGIKSLILLPMFDQSGQPSSILEIGSPKPSAFNALTLLNLHEFFNLMDLGSEKYLQDMNTMIRLFIQQQFTSIHSSVQWKFEEVATKYQVQQNQPDFDGVIDPIVFKDIYPLYGQADIVGSSKLRNKHIQADLVDNLHKVLDLMQNWTGHVQFHLLESYVLKVEGILKRVEKDFISSDESLIVDLLTREIHPLLKQLSGRYEELPQKPYQKYLGYLDEDLGIVYNKRKDYEWSVSQLNSAVSNFLESDDAKMQKILPHYFEKYKTDGVEYNLYVGDALLREGGFSPFFLKDFRIWQLVNACEITRLVGELSPTLSVPLLTAQLIFVYNNKLSIRFRMDEKQFDVDGTYNVRYEILKKRIDKAVIKGTGERLTVAGKVAIVYLQEKDKAEYLEYLEYLRLKGYISEDIEDLELEKLQGAEGLKALRVSVLEEQPN